MENNNDPKLPDVKPDEVRYIFRCAKGCGKMLGYVTCPIGTPEPAAIHTQYECPGPCKPGMIS